MNVKIKAPLTALCSRCKKKLETLKMEKVSFKQMKDGTKEDYELLGRYEERFVKDLPDRLLEMLKGLDSSLDGYQISRLEHRPGEVVHRVA